MKFLLIEDNESIAKGLEYSFKQNNINLLIANKINEGRIILSTNKIDLVILDIMLPDGNGINFYEKELKEAKIPTIVLTAIDDEDEIVKSLNLGVDEYITKPFRVKELIARSLRIINRKQNKKVIVINKYTYSMDKCELYYEGNKIEFTSLETKILNLLFININKIVTRESLLGHIWEWTGNDVDDHTITVYLKRIREKMKDDIITTVKGIGYRIDKNEEEN